MKNNKISPLKYFLVGFLGLIGAVGLFTIWYYLGIYLTTFVIIILLIFIFSKGGKKGMRGI